MLLDGGALPAESPAGRGTGTRVAAALSAAAVGALLAGGCSAPPRPHPPASRALSPASPGVPSPTQASGTGLVATAGQFRFDEGTNHLRVGVSNHGTRAVTISRAAVVWSGFDWPVEHLTTEPTPAGQTAAFVTRFTTPHCSLTPGTPALSVVVDGDSLVLPLSLDEKGLLGRLRDASCARARLSAAARVTVRIGTRAVPRGGRDFLAGRIDLRRRGQQVDPPTVRVVALGGSVLFDVLPARPHELPARLGPHTPRRVLPILVGPVDRCDAHARTNASQPFLFAVYTRLPGDRTRRLVTVPSRAEQHRLLRLLDRRCG